MSFKFLHASDLHLDTPFKGINSCSSEQMHEFQNATFQAFENLISFAIESKVQFVLFAGDIYDGIERGIKAQLAFYEGVSRLSQNNIYCFIVHGNHDPVGLNWSAIQNWPENVKVFSADKVECVEVKIRDDLGEWQSIILSGRSFAQAVETRNLALDFKRGKSQGFHIGLLHCNLGSDAGHGSYSPCTVSDLEAAQMDYWALGHIHTRKVIKTSSTTIVYPGNLQGLSMKPAEQGPKGASLVTVSGGSITDIQALEFDVIRFEEHKIRVAKPIDLPTLLNKICDEVMQIFTYCSSRDHFYRLYVEVSLEHLKLYSNDTLQMQILEHLRLKCNSHSLDNQKKIKIFWDQVILQPDFSEEWGQVVQRQDFWGELLRKLQSVEADVEIPRAWIESLIKENPILAKVDLTNLMDQKNIENLLQRVRNRLMSCWSQSQSQASSYQAAVQKD